MPFNFEINAVGTTENEGGFNVDGEDYIGGNMVEDFEAYTAGNLLKNETNKWNVPSNTGSATVVSGGLGGTPQALILDQLIRPESYSTYSDSLPRYPAEGDVIKLLLYFDTTYGNPPMFRFNFAKDDGVNDTLYRYEINLQDDYQRLQRWDGGVKTWEAYDDSVGTVPLDTELEARIKWHKPGEDHDFVIELEDTAAGNVLGTAAINETESEFLSGSGFQLWNNDYLKTIIDEIRV